MLQLCIITDLKVQNEQLQIIDHPLTQNNHKFHYLIINCIQL
jgi:hypothetical protein